jgi:hypothetical protein
MFKHIVQQVNGLVMGLFTQASMWVKARLLPSAKRLLASITQAFQSAVSLLCRVAQTALNIKAWLANLITVGQLIKVALTSVKAKVIHLGQQLLTTVRPTKQAVPTLRSPKRGRPVGSTKSARSRSKGNKTAQTPTAALLTQGGSKSQGRAKQPQQPVKQALKAKP